MSHRNSTDNPNQEDRCVVCDSRGHDAEDCPSEKARCDNCNTEYTGTECPGCGWVR